MKNKKVQIFGILLYWIFSAECISVTIKDRGNLSTYYQKLSGQSIQMKNMHQNCMRNTNSKYLPNMRNFGILALFT
jgi:hypothetical protein